MIDPWSSSIIDYEKLVNQFGIKPFADLMGDINNPNLLMRRKIIFGHRDFGKIIKSIRENKEFAVVSGMMPSGKMHIGHKMVVDQLIWYQHSGADIYIPIADMESYSARGVDFKTSKELAINEYIANYIALGLNLEESNIHVYLQSKNKMVGDLAYILSKKVNYNEMKAIYGFSGSTNIAHLYVPMIQVADIIHPQLEECGGPKPTVVPVGPDQDPHIRLTRDIAERFKSKYNFISPSATYHRFITGLTGDKMSSSKPKTAIFLSDSPEVAEKKVKTAKTGGRESLDDQRKLGGEPDKCVVYELLLYHLIDSDKELGKIYEECKNGTLMCGECKNRSTSIIKNYYNQLAERRKEAKEIADKILNGE
ncbi:MAG: tryptophan--tRNA ligase [Methanomicrobiales archaeon]